MERKKAGKLSKLLPFRSGRNCRIHLVTFRTLVLMIFIQHLLKLPPIPQSRCKMVTTKYIYWKLTLLSWLSPYLQSSKEILAKRDRKNDTKPCNVCYNYTEESVALNGYDSIKFTIFIRIKPVVFLYFSLILRNSQGLSSEILLGSQLIVCKQIVELCSWMLNEQKKKKTPWLTI